MNRVSPQVVARVFAVAFVLAGIAGFVPNPLLGPDSLFVTNPAHNFVHIVTGALFAAFAMRGNRAALAFTRTFGPIYLLVGAIGLLALGGAAEGMLLGIIHINQLDNFLHLGLGAAISAAGFLQRPAVATA